MSKQFRFQKFISVICAMMITVSGVTVFADNENQSGEVASQQIVLSEQDSGYSNGNHLGNSSAQNENSVSQQGGTTENQQGNVVNQQENAANRQSSSTGNVQESSEIQQGNTENSLSSDGTTENQPLQEQGENKNAQSEVALNLIPAGAGFRGVPLNGLNIEMRIINIEPDDSVNEETEFPVAKQINTAADINISNMAVGGSIIQKPWIVITVPRKNANGEVILSSVNFIDSVDAFHTLRLSDADNFYVIYKFDQLSGGSQMQYPFPIMFAQNPTANGDTLNLKIDMIDARTVPDDKNHNGNLNLGYIRNLPRYYAVNKDYKAKKQEVELSSSQASIYETPWKVADSRTKPISDVLDLSVNATTGQSRTVSRTIRVSLGYSADTGGLTPPVYPKPVDLLKTTIKLPVGATFVPTESNNTGWIYDSATHTISKERIKPASEDAWWIYGPGYREMPTLTFDNYPFDQEFDIKIDYSYKLRGDTVFKTLPSLTLKGKFIPNYLNTTGVYQAWKDNLSGNATTANGVKYDISDGIYSFVNNKLYDQKNDQSANGFFSTLIIRNTNNGSSHTDKENGQVAKVFAIEDIKANRGEGHKLHYKKFTFGEVRAPNTHFPEPRRTQILNQFKTDFNNTNNVLYGIKEDDSKVELARNIKFLQEVDITDNGIYKGLSLEFEQPLTLNNTDAYFYVQYDMSQDEKDAYTNGNYPARQLYYTSAKSKHTFGHNPSSNIADATYANDRWNWGYLVVDPLSPKVLLGLDGGGRIPFSASGTKFNIKAIPYLLSNNGNWGPLASEWYEETKVVMLLPPGFEYDKHIPLYNTDPIPVPEIIRDFRGTGKTALIFSLNKLSPIVYRKDRVELYTTINILPHAQKGVNKIETFYIYPKYNDVLKPHDAAQTYIDVLDLDGDGDTTELFSTRSVNVDYVSPREIMVKKHVGMSPTSLMSDNNTVDMGEEFVYQITINNGTINTVNKVEVIDVLPYNGDHLIAPDDTGQYLPRNSQYSTPLTRSLESVAENTAVLSRFDIFYKTEPQGADIESVRDGDWLTANHITDFKDVKSIKIVLKNGRNIGNGEEVKFYVPVKIPIDRSLIPSNLSGPYKSAMNSVAISGDGTIFSEGNKTTTTFKVYSLGGTFFKDFNENGLQDTADEGIKDIEVQLFRIENGVETPVMENGQQIKTKTDEHGKYSFEIFKRGKYRVKFVNMTGERFSNTTGNTAKSNNVESFARNVGSSTVADLSTTWNIATRNGAIFSQGKDLTVTKISNKTALGGVTKPVKDAKFEITSTNPAFTRMEGTTDVNGKLVFSNLPFGTYTLTEVEVPKGYEASPANRSTTFTILSTTPISDLSKTIVNNEVERDIKLTKVDKDDTSIKLQNVRFVLKEILPSTAPPSAIPREYTRITDTNGEITFADVPYGKYVLTETQNNNTGYKAPTYTNNITVDENSPSIIELGEIKNEKIKKNIKLTKVDAEDATKKLDGVEFELRKGTQVVDTKTTANGGVVIFENVGQGDYKISEKTPLVNYNRNNTEIHVSVDENSPDTITLQDFKNRIIKGSVKITKTDSTDNTKFLSGVEYQLKQGTDVVDTKTTDNNGEALFENVKYGDYKLIETKAKRGYRIDLTEHTIQIHQDGVVVEKSLENDPMFGTIKIKKVDNDTNAFLQNVEFTLHEENNQIALDENGQEIKILTDVNGIAEFTNVPVGKYKVIETRALPNYIADATPIEVELIQHGDIVEVTKRNRKIQVGGSGGGTGGSSISSIVRPLPTGKIDIVGELPGVFNSTDHFKYVMGYPDGTVRPQRNITRAEVATIYYRLLKSETRDKIFTNQNKFDDVNVGAWYNKAISSMANGNYVFGYPSGDFNGNKNITRAEFVAMISRFVEEKSSGFEFKDLKSSHWAKNSISTAVENGWVRGYEDGTFRPERPITRAEVMAITNRFLHRGVGEDGIAGLNYIRWPDNRKGKWYYYEVIEATNNHKYTGTRPDEKWLSLDIEYFYDVVKYERP